MSSQTISRAVVQTLAGGALGFSVLGTAVGAFFTAIGLDNKGSLLTGGSLFLFTVIGFVIGALVATSICLWRAAQRLPPTSLSPEAVAQEKKLQGSLALLFGVVTAVVGGARWSSLHLASDRRSWLYRDLLAVRTIPAV